MTIVTRNSIGASTGTVVDRHERSARAVRAFNAMVPGLTAYVRAMTGNPAAIVQAGPATSTDGRYIYIRPPMVLADTADHERLLCDKREGYELLCPACNKTEAVWSALYHEMSHITSGSLARHTSGSLARIVTEAMKAWPEACKQPVLDNMKAKLRGNAKRTVYEATEHIHPYLINLLRATDDWVIESRAFAARAGVESMLYHQTQQLLSRGVEQQDGTYALWQSQPVEVQLPVAVLLELHGWGLDSFGEETVKAVRSPRVAAAIDRVSETGASGTILDSLSLAVELLGEFNWLGYYRVEAEPEPKSGPGNTGDTGDADDTSDSGTDASVSDAGDSNGSSVHDDGQNNNESDTAEPTPDNSTAGNEPDEPDSSGGTGRTDPVDNSASDADADNGDTTEQDSADADVADNSGTDGSDADDGGMETASTASTASTAATGEETDDNASDPADRANGTDASDSTDEADSTGEADAAEKEAQARATETKAQAEAEAGTGSSGDTGDQSNAEAAETLAAVAAADSGDMGDSDPAQVSVKPAPPSPEEISAAMEQMMGHDSGEQIMNDGYHGKIEETQALETAINQAMFFDSPSTAVGKLKLHRGDDMQGSALSYYGDDSDYRPLAEGEIAPTIHRARRVFSDNALDKHVNNLKKGKLSARNLGARGWGDDERLFRKKIRANKTDYEVVIGMDVSGSVSRNGRANLIKTAGYAMAETLNRINIPFSMYAHTTSMSNMYYYDQDMYEIKGLHDPWSKSKRELLSRLHAAFGSLDGHNFEFYRKTLMHSRAKKRLCIYFTDGNIPETNHTEEREIMVRESKLYKKLDMEALIVAVDVKLKNTYGFDQVHLNRTADMGAVLKALEKKLTGGA